MKKSTISQRCRTILRIWKYSLGSFSDDKTSPYDNSVAIIRTCIFVSYMVTNVFIISGVIRHWNPMPKRELSAGMLLLFDIQEKMDYLEWDLNEYSYEVVTHHDIPNKDDGYIVIRKVPRPVDGWETVRKLDSYLDDVL